MAADMNSKKKKMNPILWFLFTIVVPFIAVMILALIILTVTGVDVAGWAKRTGSSIPVVSDVISADKEEGEQQKKATLQETIADKDSEINQLNQQVSSLESTIDEMEQEILKLEQNETTGDEMSSEHEGKETSQTDSIKTMASSFSDMDNEKAAQIFQSMEEDLVIAILEHLPDDARGEIFEAMEPDAAAEYTQQFVNQTE
ncbi:hypothetical protein E4U82_01780 [Lentibacillus salicampi]|uniref:Magnesium transporter MgtE intracellular domain-containing protein n=2 Tax=Lentibacillus salicampi TaxID=175306 RepID=A0A4Y9AHV5_9BACI|nr:hypothetical protein E4U82_01780 [Lentibacillus salicampi]